MAKKAKKAKKAPKRVFTKEQVLADWIDALEDGLDGKTLNPAIAVAFESKLLAKIEERLKAGADYSKDRRNTRAVAKFIGELCKELTPGTTVLLGVFEKVFAVGQLHPKCPGGGGGSGQY